MDFRSSLAFAVQKGNLLTAKYDGMEFRFISTGNQSLHDKVISILSQDDRCLHCVNMGKISYSSVIFVQTKTAFSRCSIHIRGSGISVGEDKTTCNELQTNGISLAEKPDFDESHFAIHWTSGHPAVNCKVINVKVLESENNLTDMKFQCTCPEKKCQHIIVLLRPTTPHTDVVLCNIYAKDME